MTGRRGAAHHCSICGATHRNRVTHQEGMTRAEHEQGAKDTTRPPLTDPQPDTPPMTRQEAMRAMDEAVEDLVAQEDEAATMAPPTEDSDTVRLEVLGARLEYEDGHLFVVFKVGPDYFSGRLDRYIPPEFDPLDLIRKEDE